MLKNLLKKDWNHILYFVVLFLYKNNEKVDFIAFDAAFLCGGGYVHIR